MPYTYLGTHVEYLESGRPIAFGDQVADGDVCERLMPLLAPVPVPAAAPVAPAKTSTSAAAAADAPASPDAAPAAADATPTEAKS